jgi:uncharacterized glyoxalase superfamily protein PhnB
MTTTKDTVRITSLIPSFTVDDIHLSLAFYEGLGFEVEERWEEQGKLSGVMLRAGDTRIGLTQDDWKKGRDRKKGAGMRVFIATSDVDEVARRAKTAGITLNTEPHDTEWEGGRAFEVTDPSGFLLTISTEMA